MKIILTMLLTMLPVVLGAAANMLLTKTAFFKSHRKPIDGGKMLGSERIFGENKSWIGFFSYIVCCTAAQLLVGFMCRGLHLDAWNQMYALHRNTVPYNLLVGSLFGLAYALFELPNSFLKRRFHVPSGGHAKGAKGVFFFILDQVDSLIGCAIVIGVFSDARFLKLVQYVLLGAFVHILVNLLLMALHARKSL
ncbi:MAG: CDP-archaeol synthase [Lachnospiraceae bacterium]|nr:CDP-archaeol synthase [Lachnospiraceae bacterium]